MFIRLHFLFFVFLLPLGCEKQPAKVNKQSPQKVRIAKVIEINLGGKLEFPGVIRAKNQSRLSFATGGRLISQDLGLGDHVKKGDLIARLDANGFSIGVQAAGAAYRARKEQRDQLARDLQRSKKLLKQGALTRVNFEKIESALNQAESGLQASKQALRESKRKRGETRLLAPFDGVVTSLYAEAGEVISPGHPVLRLVGEDIKEVRIEVSQSMASQISIEDKVSMYTNEGVQVDAKVNAVLASVTNERGLHPIVLDLPKNSKIAEGSDVTIRIHTSPQKQTLAPLGAVVDPSGQSPFVWKVSEGKVRKVPVKLGELFEGKVSLRGIEVGADIVVAGQGRLLENDEVSQE